MPHYDGHIPNGTLNIYDKLKNKTYNVHGYLFVNDLNGKPDESIRVLFHNNCGLVMPKNVPNDINGNSGSLEGWDKDKKLKEELKKRKVGFHLLIIDMPTLGLTGKSKWGIAYNLAKWDDHENTEGSLQAVNRFTGKRVEDIDPDELSYFAREIGIVTKDTDAKKIKKVLDNTGPDHKTASLILGQSAQYMKTESFKMTRAGGNHHAWIKNNIAEFEDMASLFGVY